MDFWYEVVWLNQVSNSACPYLTSKREMLNNKMTFLNSAVALKEHDKPDIKLYNETYKYKLVQPFWLAPSTGTHTESNPECTPPGGQRAYKKGLTTGSTVTSNRLWNPVVILTGLLSKQQQYPKRTADQQGKWITTWDGAILSSCVVEKLWSTVASTVPTVGNINGYTCFAVYCFLQ